MKKQAFQGKQAFALITTMLLIVLFAIFSIGIVENNMTLSNLNKLKYLHLQANIHMEKIENTIESKTESEIENLTLNDTRYNMEILKANENNTTVYYVDIDAVNEPVRIYKRIEK